MNISDYITREEVQRVCQELGIRDWTQLSDTTVEPAEAEIIQQAVGSEALEIPVAWFRQGLEVELEHGMQFPDANVQFAGDKLRRFSRSDVAVAVAIDGGLITPIVKGADLKGVAAISSEMKELAGRAKEGKLAPEEYQGGTIAISNLGMFGVKEFLAVINPPQASILAIGAGEKRPVVRNDQLAIATLMSVTMACDHRAMDGAVGAQFLQVFKTLLEHPVRLLI